MKITLDEIEYTIDKCSAIALCDLEDGARQDALLVQYTNDSGEEIKAVVFGFEMPTDADDFSAMIDEPFAWESDWEVLNTVIAA